MLRVDDNKTELMLAISTRAKILHNRPTSITIGNTNIPFKQSVKNFGLALDCRLAMNEHVSVIARTCCFDLRRLSSIRRFPTNTVTDTLVSAFVLPIIDYCNSLLFGSIHDVTSHLNGTINTELCTSSNLARSKISWKHLQNSLFVLPLSHQYCTVVCHLYAAVDAITLLQHSIQLTQHASFQ